MPMSPVNRGRRRGGSLLGVLLAAVGCRAPAASEAECASVMAWVAERAPAAGAHDMTLPDDLRASSHDGHVRVLVGADGRRCLLLKRQIGYKGNFEATLYCDAPLRPGELVERPDAPRTVSILGDVVFEELFVREAHGDRRFSVYFDLN